MAFRGALMRQRRGAGGSAKPDETPDRYAQFEETVVDKKMESDFVYAHKWEEGHPLAEVYCGVYLTVIVAVVILCARTGQCFQQGMAVTKELEWTNLNPCFLKRSPMMSVLLNTTEERQLVWGDVRSMSEVRGWVLNVVVPIVERGWVGGEENTVIAMDLTINNYEVVPVTYVRWIEYLTNHLNIPHRLFQQSSKFNANSTHVTFTRKQDSIAHTLTSPPFTNGEWFTSLTGSVSVEVSVLNPQVNSGQQLTYRFTQGGSGVVTSSRSSHCAATVYVGNVTDSVCVGLCVMMGLCVGWYTVVEVLGVMKCKTKLMTKRGVRREMGRGPGERVTWWQVMSEYLKWRLCMLIVQLCNLCLLICVLCQVCWYQVGIGELGSVDAVTGVRREPSPVELNKLRSVIRSLAACRSVMVHIFAISIVAMWYRCVKFLHEVHTDFRVIYSVVSEVVNGNLFGVVQLWLLQWLSWGGANCILLGPTVSVFRTFWSSMLHTLLMFLGVPYWTVVWASPAGISAVLLLFMNLFIFIFIIIPLACASVILSVMKSKGAHSDTDTGEVSSCTASTRQGKRLGLGCLKRRWHW
eukprot:GHVN01025179.1.p1 GENE.GHVN01025179.1~~GHVN01025179.1.p1  ORF type:complete len:579 (-),score=90.22 GHVN01025179.1:403-2139(-)